MWGQIERLRAYRRRHGTAAAVVATFRYVYRNYVWPALPQTDRRLRYNGITIGRRRRRLVGLFRLALPGEVTRETTDRPAYEERYVDCLRASLREGEAVTLVGGGWGVSAVVAARSVGESGRVTVFEGAEEAVERTRNTVELNGVADRVTVRQAIVSDDVALRGDDRGAPIVPPEDLPACDALALDCDGAEVHILEALAVRPETIVVEHHPVVREGALLAEHRPETIRAILEDRGYEIVRERRFPHEPSGEYETYFVARR